MSNIAKWRTFTKEQVEEMVASSISLREVALKMGYQQNGGGIQIHRIFQGRDGIKITITMRHLRNFPIRKMVVQLQKR